LVAMLGIAQAEVELELELDAGDDLSLPLLELSLFLDSVFFDSLFESDEAGDFDPLSLFDSDEAGGFELLSPSLFDSPLVCPLRA
jgi:hypothetical protein